MIKKLYGELGAYKGSNGKTATIGGSFEYTGAPYYAAISSLKAVRIIQGGDLAHVFCTKSAGTAIKSYSPELIVHPLLRSLAEEPELHTNSDWKEIAEEAVELTSRWFHTVHSVIIGPGLGRDPYLNEHIIPGLFQAARKESILQLDMKLVVDADGLNFMCSNTEALRNYSNAIITPNIVETRRLWDAFIAGEVQVEPNMPSVSTNKIFTDLLEVPVDEPEMIAATRLARVLGCTVCIKGPVDVISDGRRGILVNTLGSLKRAGGIGDVLSGTMAVAMLYGERNAIDYVEAAACSCMIVRTASRFAYTEKGRSLTAVDVIDKMSQSLKHYIDE